MASVDDADREADRILDEFARERSLRPLYPVKAWERRRIAPLARITEGELRMAWQQLAEARSSGNKELIRAATNVFKRDLMAFLEP